MHSAKRLRLNLKV